MAKKVTQRKRGSTTSRRSNTRGRRSGSSYSGESLLERPLEGFDLRKFNGNNYKNVVRDFSKSSSLLYLVGGIGAFFLGRWALRYYQNHPEISEFIKENVDTVEARLREFRGGEIEEVRH